jgi:hypothetical protein
VPDKVFHKTEVEDQTGTAKIPGIALRLAKFFGVSEDS